MCFTGGFALAMMTEPSVVAPVLSQPSLPLTFGSKARAAGINVSPEEVSCAKDRFEKEDLSMIGLRFFGDSFVPDARFDTYKKTFGNRFEAIEIDPKDAEPGPMQPHSVLTVNLQDRPRHSDQAGRRAGDRVLPPAHRRCVSHFSRSSFLRAASDIMCGVQGGSHTISTLARSQSGSPSSLSSMFSRIIPPI
jgi:hypothetical protein